MSQAPCIVTPAVLRDMPLPDGAGGKESRGRTLVIGGSAETPGGVLLAAEAALRSGAGKLQIATAASVAAILAVAVPEAMVRRLPETPAGAVAASGAGRTADLVEDAACVLVGPGLTDVAESAALAVSVVRDLHRPLVLDALALAAVTNDHGCVRHLAGQVVLTPNPGELARCLHEDQGQLSESPDRAGLRLAERTGAVVSVGGEVSWVATPDGQLFRDDGGGPGLGISGAGDVRAGLVAGLLARGADPVAAAVWAAHLHGRAGERLSARSGPLGYLARELLPQVPPLLVELGQGASHGVAHQG
jgi:ADP-dependent NAD(P)H-hydrate dehydratase